MSREFVHAVTGRSIVVAEGSRTERLVVGDDNWAEVDAKKAPAKKTAAKKAPAKKTAAKKPAAKRAAPKQAPKAETPEAPAETPATESD